MHFVKTVFEKTLLFFADLERLESLSPLLMVFYCSWLTSWYAISVDNLKAQH